jgi:hypothetical protein
MAKIEDLRILPPIAIGRFGSASEPLDNYTLEDDPDHPLGYRRIRPAPTLVVNDAGEVAEKPPAEAIEFTATEDGEGGERLRIRPVAPFLEVFAKLEGQSELVPLSVGLLAKRGSLWRTCAGAPRWRTARWSAAPVTTTIRYRPIPGGCRATSPSSSGANAPTSSRRRTPISVSAMCG